MRNLAGIVFTLAFALSAKASVTYAVSVDTSTISGTAGSLDFNFDPGPNTAQNASLQILNFTSNGMLFGSPATMGDVSGTLPGQLAFDNLMAFNDYFQDFDFGSAITFQVYLYGPAFNSPDGVSASGSTFAFSMYSDAAGTMPVLTNDTTFGTVFTTDINLDGTTTVTNNSPETTVAAAPEPATLLPMAVGIALLGVARLRKASRPQAAASQTSQIRG